MSYNISSGNIRFTHDSIGSEFGNGESVNETIKRIIKGRMKAADLPTIRVVKIDTNFYSLDNRRLYVFRALHYKGLLKSVHVNITNSYDYEKITTTNDGISLYVRGDYTYPHAITAKSRRMKDEYRCMNIPSSTTTIVSSSSSSASDAELEDSSSDVENLYQPNSKSFRSYGSVPQPSFAFPSNHSTSNPRPQHSSNIVDHSESKPLLGHRYDYRSINESTIQSPGNIRFTHDSIGSEFGNGKSVNETIERIIKGQMKATDLPTIRVVKIGTDFYSLDNRRLYVFRALHYKGLLKSVYVNITNSYDYEKITTTNDGISLYVRGDYTYPHAITAKARRSLVSATVVSSSSSSASDAESEASTSEVKNLHQPNFKLLASYRSVPQPNFAFPSNNSTYSPGPQHSTNTDGYSYLRPLLNHRYGHSSTSSSSSSSPQFQRRDKPCSCTKTCCIVGVICLFVICSFITVAIVLIKKFLS